MNCKWCGDPLGSDLLEYCGDECRESAEEERSEKAGAPVPPRLVTPASSDRKHWVDLIRYSILAAAAQHPHYQVHADDIRALGVPEKIRRAHNGEQFKALARDGLLASTGETRRSRARSRHGNPSLVYTITAAGLAEFRSMPEPEEVTAALHLVPDSVGAEAPKSHITSSEAA